MGASSSRQIGHDDGVAERGCARLLPCFGSQPALAGTSLPDARNGGPGRGDSDMYQSCDDLSAVAQAVNRPERLVLELGVTLRALRALQLPSGGDAACERVAKELQHLESVLAADPASFASTTSHSTVELSARDGEASQVTTYTASEAPDTAAAKTPKSNIKDKLHKAVVVAQSQKDLGMGPGSLSNALNSMISILWPRIDTFVENLIHTSIEPSINASLPGMLQGSVKFTKVSLGDASPLLGPMVVTHDEESGAIQMKMGIDFSSDLDIELSAMAVPVGITKIFLKGDLIILFSPPMLKPPFFGGVQVYFPNPPDVGVSFVGAAKVANVPGLRGAIRGAIDGAVAGVCVLPRRIAVDMNDEDDVDIIDLTHPEPIGILRFTLWSGASLVAADTSFTPWGTSTSDPYVVASLGITNWTSPHISKNLNPEWGEGSGLTVDFPVHNQCQALCLKVFDYDFGSADDLIGVAKSEDVQGLSATGGKQHVVQLLTADGASGGGSLTISATLLSLKEAQPTSPLSALGPSEAHISAKVTEVHGLKDHSDYPFKVRVQVVHADDDCQAPKKTASAKLKPSKSSLGAAAAKVQVLAEGITADSHVKVHESLGETLQGVAKQLNAKGSDAKEIAEILDVSPVQVDRFLNTLDPAKAAEEEKAQQEFLNVHHPCFDEVVQFLLPNGSVDSLASVDLVIVDKRAKVLATARVPMSQVLEAPELKLEGPFMTDVEGVEVSGSLQLRWLA